ncbi:MAG: hypothetical protein COW30_01020 [Rhodospirillales bacterium CG15_BIG_FIL_POST_REV_8_21_14_020_66_15]|nr:MAG: hypothetical protein COW30_01020 [Rhodospirillales bacterium CG15_BIG_FIL_POST_REV_8_21_14_020_66_15]
MKRTTLTTAVCCLSLAAVAGFAPRAASAQVGDVFDALAAQPVTILDAGIKRVRAGAQSAAKRLTNAAGPPAQYRVVFDRNLRRLEIRFEVTVEGSKVNETFCWARRGVAVREMFGVGVIRYTVQLSDEEKVRRRLGIMFSREPEATDREFIALGQRLADSTFVELNLVGSTSESSVTCRAVVHRLDWR